MSLIYFVYEDGCKEMGPFKIGMTYQPMQIRLRRLQTGNPRKLFILKTINIHIDHLAKAEKSLHRKMLRARIGRSEWFRVDREFVRDLDWDADRKRWRSKEMMRRRAGYAETETTRALLKIVRGGETNCITLSEAAEKLASFCESR